MAKRTQGRPAGLSGQRIAAAAVKLVDRDGLDAFGVRRLAAELGVDPMSIYNHIRGKAALLDAISEAVLTEAAPGVVDWPTGWIELARWMAHNYREMALRHPRVFPLLTTRTQRSPVALEAIERLSAAMRQAGLADQVVADAPIVLFGFLNGYLTAMIGGGPDERTGMPEPDPDAYPTMAALAALQADFGSLEQFDRMLELVLAGLGRSRAVRPG